MRATVHGVIVYDSRDSRFSFKEHLTSDHFEDGIYKTDWADYVFICNHTISIDAPDGFDAKAAALESLSIQEDKIRKRYLADMRKIDLGRQALRQSK
jgi:hypothetical protein